VCKVNGSIATCGNFWGGTYTITSCSEPIPDIGSLPGCGYVMFPPNGGLTTTGTLLFRSDDSESANVRWDYIVGGTSTLEVCASQTTTIPHNTGSFVYQTYVNLIGTIPYPQNNITFTISTSTPTSMGGTFTGTYLYPIAGPIVNGVYPSATGTVSGTWTVSPLSTPFPKCIVPKPFDLCTDGYGAESTNPVGPDGPCTFIPLTSPAPPGEWIGYP
jgi:hypothetical protein